MFKKIIFILCIIFIFVGTNFNSITDFGKTVPSFTDISDNFLWAKNEILTLAEKGAIGGITENLFSPSSLVSKEQLAKMLCITFDISSKNKNLIKYSDVDSSHWAHAYIGSIGSFFPQDMLSPDKFNPQGACTREDLAVVCAEILNLPEENTDFLNNDFLDFYLVSESNKGLFASAVKAGIISGADGFLYPKKELTRAEACVIIKRAYDLKNQAVKTEKLSNKIIGDAQISLSQAKKWAEAKNADARFLDVASLYWEYGKKTGIRPEVLYAQAAKETNYGKYTGNVQPHQNNWAGIKTVSASGDAALDHESFNTPEDGVRGHFNHMCAYVGLAPIGEPHERFNKTVTASWAGKVRNIEDLGGKWAPAIDYGESILNDFLMPMSQY